MQRRKEQCCLAVHGVDTDHASLLLLVTSNLLAQMNTALWQVLFDQVCDMC